MGNDALLEMQAEESQLEPGPDVPSAEELFRDEALEQLRHDDGLREIVQDIRERETRIEARIENTDLHEVRRICLDVVATDLLEVGLTMPESALDDPDSFFQAVRAFPFAPVTAVARRQSREIARMMTLANEGSLRVPASVEELHGIWGQAMFGEPRWNERFPTSDFRTDTVTIRGPLPDQEILHVCMDPAEMPEWLDSLIRFMADEDTPLELRATCALGMHDWIHPFSDGNGHVGRLLALALLSSRYSLPTLAFFSRELVVRRSVTTRYFGQLRSREADIRGFCRGLLGQLADAQELALRVFG